MKGEKVIYKSRERIRDKIYRLNIKYIIEYVNIFAKILKKN